jgi:hypothetical protein
VQHISDAAEEAIKIAPPAAAVIWTIAGMSLDEVVAWLTILYLLVLLVEKVAKWIMAWSRRGG